MISYYKGKFLDTETINVNEKLFRGIGIFETIKFSNNKMLFFDEHINRLFSNIFFDLSKIKKQKIYLDAMKVINKNSILEGLIKIIVIPLSEDWDDLEYYIFIRKLPQVPKEQAKIIFYSEALYPILRFYPMYKSLSYMGNFIAIRDAKLAGAFEPIFYNESHIITEGAIRNIFFIKDDTIYTPSTDLGILNGITRQKIIQLAISEGYKVEKSHINYDDINNMDEAFITSSTIDLLPCYWDGWNSNHSISIKLKNLYNENIKIK